MLSRLSLFYRNELSSPAQSLVPELLIQIFGYLGCESYLVLGSVCRLWRTVIYSAKTWRTFDLVRSLPLINLGLIKKFCFVYPLEPRRICNVQKLNVEYPLLHIPHYRDLVCQILRSGKVKKVNISTSTLIECLAFPRKDPVSGQRYSYESRLSNKDAQDFLVAQSCYLPGDLEFLSVYLNGPQSSISSVSYGPVIDISLVRSLFNLTILSSTRVFEYHSQSVDLRLLRELFRQLSSLRELSLQIETTQSEHATMRLKDQYDQFLEDKISLGGVVRLRTTKRWLLELTRKRYGISRDVKDETVEADQRYMKLIVHLRWSASKVKEIEFT